MKLQAGITALAVGLGMFVLACDQAPTTLDAPDIRAAVKLVDTNEFVEITDFAIENPCVTPPEVILFSGTSHDIVKIWDTGRLHLHLQFNLRGTDSNGVEWMVTDAFNWERKGGGFPQTFNYTAKAVSKGSADNVLFSQHRTVNANGEVTALTPFGFKCVG